MDIKNVVYQQVIDREEIEEAFKMEQEDLERERAGSPRFESNFMDANAPETPQHAIHNRTSTSRRTTATPIVQPPPTTRRNTRQRTPQIPQIPQLPFPIPQNFTNYGGTTPDGIQYYGSAEALDGYCMQIGATRDGNCFFQ
jgi:hypothetical protein